MLTIELNMYHAVALGAFLFWMGGIITDKVRLLNRYCIPAPLVGGLCFSILNCILYSAGIASITFDGTLQTVFMILFFTTVGFTVSIPALLKGGKAVMLCLIVSIVMIPLQNFLGGGVMEVFGCDPLLGIGCGSIALIGGPGTAAAFGPDLEAAGAVGGSVVSIAAATFGLVAGSLMGGPTARRLIEKHNLRPETMTAIGGTSAVFLLRRNATRVFVLVSGLIVGVVNAGVVACISLLTSNDLTSLLSSCFYAVLGSFVAGILCVGLQPMLESAFNLVTPGKLIELSNPNHLDVVTLKAELNPDFDFDQVAAIERLQKAIQTKCKAELSVGIKVKLVEPMTIARSVGKAKRVIDLRTGVFND